MQAGVVLTVPPLIQSSMPHQRETLAYFFTTSTCCSSSRNTWLCTCERRRPQQCSAARSARMAAAVEATSSDSCGPANSSMACAAQDSSCWDRAPAPACTAWRVCSTASRLAAAVSIPAPASPNDEAHCSVAASAASSRVAAPTATRRHAASSAAARLPPRISALHSTIQRSLTTASSPLCTSRKASCSCLRPAAAWLVALPGQRSEAAALPDSTTLAGAKGSAASVAAPPATLVLPPPAV
mmetsp:Transcript_3908/g.11344  ORF Transcript_3908/g.11344 Transcript_3908/m.11344 type:complete len:241 (+) Transcript_3908:279-1001(+)